MTLVIGSIPVQPVASPLFGRANGCLEARPIDYVDSQMNSRCVLIDDGDFDQTESRAIHNCKIFDYAFWLCHFDYAIFVMSFWS